jgi:hypothetical protein
MQNRLRLSIPLLSLSLFVAVGCSPSTPAPTATTPAPVASAPATTPAATTPPATTPATPSASPTPVASATPAATPTPGGKAKTKNVYDEVFVKSYMEGCVKSSNNAPYCECTITKIQDQYTLEEFIKITQSMTPGQEPPAEMMKIVTACAKP